MVLYDPVFWREYDRIGRDVKSRVSSVKLSDRRLSTTLAVAVRLLLSCLPICADNALSAPPVVTSLTIVPMKVSSSICTPVSPLSDARKSASVPVLPASSHNSYADFPSSPSVMTRFPEPSNDSLFSVLISVPETRTSCFSASFAFICAPMVARSEPLTILSSFCVAIYLFF